MLLFRFGVISDVQYSDIDPKYSFHGVLRLYRESLQKLQNAINSYNNDSDLHFVIHLGDLIDYKCKQNSIKEMKRVIDVFDQLQYCKSYHVIGNHDIYWMNKLQFNEITRIKSEEEDCSYYYFEINKEYRGIVLDTYDISVMSKRTKEKALRILKQYNKNKDVNAPPIDKNDITKKRFVMFSGGIGKKQLLWLKDDALNVDGKKCIIFTHCSLHKDVCDTACLCWNYDEVMAIIKERENVNLIVNGHNHKYGYVKEVYNGNKVIIHLSIQGVIQSLNEDCHGIISVFNDKVVMEGTNGFIKRKTEFHFDHSVN